MLASLLELIHFNSEFFCCCREFRHWSARRMVEMEPFQDLCSNKISKLSERTKGGKEPIGRNCIYAFTHAFPHQSINSYPLFSLIDHHAASLATLQDPQLIGFRLKHDLQLPLHTNWRCPIHVCERAIKPGNCTVLCQHQQNWSSISCC